MIIAISGKARSGKDTFAKILAKELQRVENHSYVLMAYAHELKLRVQKDFDLFHEQLWGKEKEIQDKRYLKTEGVYWTPREIMQEYGSFYRSIDGDYWVKQLFNIIDRAEYKHVIITDARYPNEIKPVVDRGGFHIRVIRDDKEIITNEAHSSETSLDEDSSVDFLVDNNGTLKDLHNTTENLVIGIMKFMSRKENKNG